MRTTRGLISEATWASGGRKEDGKRTEEGREKDQGGHGHGHGHGHDGFHIEVSSPKRVQNNFGHQLVRGAAYGGEMAKLKSTVTVFFETDADADKMTQRELEEKGPYTFDNQMGHFVAKDQEHKDIIKALSKFLIKATAFSGNIDHIIITIDKPK